MTKSAQPYADLYARSLLDSIHEAGADKVKQLATETSPGVYTICRKIYDADITMIADFNEETATAKAELIHDRTNVATTTYHFDDYTPPSDDDPIYVKAA